MTKYIRHDCKQRGCIAPNLCEALADAYDKALAQVAEHQRTLHTEVFAGPANAAGICNHCREDYPCPTIQLVDAQ